MLISCFFCGIGVKIGILVFVWFFFFIVWYIVGRVLIEIFKVCCGIIVGKVRIFIGVIEKRVI